jgi:hypothetical protein
MELTQPWLEGFIGFPRAYPLDRLSALAGGGAFGCGVGLRGRLELSQHRARSGSKATVPSVSVASDRRIGDRRDGNADHVRDRVAKPSGAFQ